MLGTWAAMLVLLAIVAGIAAFYGVLIMARLKAFLRTMAKLRDKIDGSTGL